MVFIIRREWTKSEEKEFIEMYPFVINNDIALIFKRNISSIQHKAVRLGLKKNKKIFALTQSKLRSGDKCVSWNGGRKKSKHGYVFILNKEHPNSDSNGYIQEHRIVMEKHLNRLLNKNEVVHHINGIRDDNRIENLKLMTNAEHTALHNKERGKKNVN